MDADIKTPQDALEWLDRSIREEAELDGEISNANAIRVGFIRNMLSRFPLRNCDVGTAEERLYRYNRLRDEINERYKRLGEIPPAFAFPTAFEWEDRPYEEGGAK